MVTMLDGKPSVKVIDFGISKSLEGDLALGPDMTLRGTVLGTPRYMSPEQAGLTGQDVDPRAARRARGTVRLVGALATSASGGSGPGWGPL